MAKFSFRDKLILLAAVLFLFFLTGWYLTHRGGEAGKAYTVFAQRPEEAAAAVESPEVSQNPAPGLLEGEKININTASEADLTRLPGIGEKRAEDIVAWRGEHGPFEKPEDIIDVPGIGKVTLQKIISYITV